MSYVIGIDSGGTHIVGQAFNEDNQLLSQVQSGPGNIFLNEEETLKNLSEVIDSLITQHGPANCKYILIGIAGVETKGNSKEVAEKLTQKFQIKTYVISDAQLALLNGLEGIDGTLVISGTGSVVYGRQNQQMLRFGGWGNLLGDTGSAYKITVTAMKKMLHQYDLGKTSSLQSTLLAQLNAQSPKEAVKNFYALNRKEIAAIALEIAKLADNADQEAIEVIKEEALALSNEIIGLFSRYQGQHPKDIALSGSVLVHNAMFRKFLTENVLKSYPDINATVVDTNNARGAIFWPLWNK
ncbi:BadF/BadG/BcrA/BcrD ATPase family protein [Companilactobacillus sp. HBUAS59544]|uniref:BadF/BadG/BcrA/BcrD ATPase family protein n=1 Tax=Companilactobacillus sp. HBUAS59544 TaxID=3109363 RepID=UPI002FF1DC78